MAKRNQVTAEVTADVTKFKKGMAEATSSIGQLDKGVKDLATGAAAGYALGKVVAFGKDAVSAASNLNEVVSYSKVVFGASAGEIERWGEAADESLSMSKRQAIDAATGFASLGKAAGLSGSELVGFSKQMVALAADMASAKNTSVDQAITAIGAAMRGEMEPIRQYGVVLDDATLRQEALRLGIIQTTSQALTPQQKVLAAQAAILGRTADMQGDLARTSDGLANQQRKLAAEFENIKATLGESLLPVVSDAFGMVNKLAKAWNHLSPSQQQAIGQFAGIETAGALAAIAISKVGAAAGAASPKMVAFGAASFYVATVLAALSAKGKGWVGISQDMAAATDGELAAAMKKVGANSKPFKEILDELVKQGEAGRGVLVRLAEAGGLDAEQSKAVATALAELDRRQSQVNETQAKGVKVTKEKTAATVDLGKAQGDLADATFDLRQDSLDLADAQDRIREAQEALKPVVVDTTREQRALAEAQDAVSEASKKLADAQAAEREVLHGVATDSDKATQAFQDYAQAMRDADAANRAVADAEERKAAALERIDKLRNGDPKAAATASRKVTDAELDLADAKDRLTEAQAKLKDKNADQIKTAREITRAELEVQDREQALTDARDALTKATEGYAEGSAEMKDATRDLVDAEMALMDAQGRAYEATNKATDAYGVQQGTLNGFAEGSPQWVAAHDAVSAAQKDLADKTLAAADAEKALKDKVDEGTVSLDDRRQKVRDLESAYLALEAVQKRMADDEAKRRDAQAKLDPYAEYSRSQRNPAVAGQGALTGGNITYVVVNPPVGADLAKTGLEIRDALAAADRRYGPSR